MAKETAAQRKERIHQAALQRRAAARSTPASSGNDPLGLDALIAQATAGAGSSATQAQLYGLTASLAAVPVFTGDDIAPGTPGQARWMTPKRPTKSVLDSVTDLYQLDSRELATLQQHLYDANYFSSTYYAKGGKSKLQSKYVDDDTRAAYVNALIDAARSGTTVDDLLSRGAGTGIEGSGSATQPFAPQISSPEEIKSRLATDFTSDLGHGLTDAEMNSLVNIYQSLQVSSQRQAYDTNISGGTSTAIQPIDVFAEEQAKKLHPNDYQAKKLANLSKQVLAGLNLGTTGNAPVDRVF